MKHDVLPIPDRPYDAARGGLEGADFAWGDEAFPNGQVMANTWQGEFPWQNLLADGYGLLDVTGKSGIGPKACCAPRDPRRLAPVRS